MEFAQIFYCFQFDNDLILNKNIGKVFSNCFLLVIYLYRNLTFSFETFIPQFNN